MTAHSGHVFVSHSSDNRELAKELASFLEARGIKVWIAPRDVRPGMDYSEELQRAIEQCAAFVVLVTEMANKSPYVRAETEMAFSSHKPIFPVRTSDMQPAPGLAFFLKIRHWTDAFGPGRAESLDRLVLELKAVSAAAEVPADPPAAAPPIQAFAAAPAADPAPGAAGAPSPPAAPATPEEEELWRAAVGANAAYFLDRWRAMDAKGSAISWNWVACFFNLFWFAYRKMWLPMIGIIVAMLVLGVIGAAPGAGAVAWLLTIGLSFLTGAFGNSLYRRQTARLIAETSALGRAAQIEALKARGGVSAPALAISIGVFAVVILVLLLVAVAIQQAQMELMNQGYDMNDGTYDESEPLPDKPEADPGYYEDY